MAHNELCPGSDKRSTHSPRCWGARGRLPRELQSWLHQPPSPDPNPSPAEHELNMKETKPPVMQGAYLAVGADAGAASVPASFHTEDPVPAPQPVK